MPKLDETSDLIAKLQKDLRALQAIPEARREAELADIREAMCREMLADLLAGRPLAGDRFERCSW